MNIYRFRRENKLIPAKLALVEGAMQAILDHEFDFLFNQYVPVPPPLPEELFLTWYDRRYPTGTPTYTDVKLKWQFECSKALKKWLRYRDTREQDNELHSINSQMHQLLDTDHHDQWKLTRKWMKTYKLRVR